MIYIWHHTDNDGKLAAAIAYQAHSDVTDPIPCRAVDYNKPLPIEELQEGDQVIIVDFSPNDPAEMDKIIEAIGNPNNIVWIDHHRTSLEKYSGYDHIPGRRETREAGCVLTWEYFCPSVETPRVVLLVGDRDVWRWAYGDETALLHAGLSAQDTGPYSEVWMRLMMGDKLFMQEVLAEGGVIQRMQKIRNAEMLDLWGFERYVQGHSAICLNRMRCGSEAFGEAEYDYPILVSFGYDGEQVVVSLYSSPNPDGIPQVDVGRIAEDMGGGGHPGAAGFTCSFDEFEKFLSVEPEKSAKKKVDKQPEAK